MSALKRAANTVLDTVHALVDFALHREPAVVLGGIAAVAIEAQTVVVNGNAHDWKTAVPLLLGALVRQLVTPAVAVPAPPVAPPVAPPNGTTSGVLTATTSYVVGEKGPEMVVTGGTITPAPPPDPSSN